MNSTRESNPETQGGWKTFGIKRPTLDERRVSFSWVELTNNENVTSMFWEHIIFQLIDMRVTLLRSAEDIIKSLIPPQDRDRVGKCTFARHFYCSFQKIKFLLG